MARLKNGEIGGMNRFRERGNWEKERLRRIEKWGGGKEPIRLFGLGKAGGIGRIGEGEWGNGYTITIEGLGGLRDWEKTGGMRELGGADLIV
ncbi:MAG: hypothetical protein JW984_05915 [Deltaproteobacteria bacterium]|uniref:Uncharacterized protein n=1 Tax=Candidatus Zymogenus saltonus TaxID=2844893 RepID=A0A9D8PN10_9DELT|nr:hypothetical protein [Candidatus Zymogenus saltonus]